MRINFVYGIIVGILIGCFAGYFVAKQKSSSPAATQQTTAQSPPSSGEPLQCDVCPCNSWGVGILDAPKWDEKMYDNLITDYQSKVYLRWKAVKCLKSNSDCCLKLSII